MDTLDSRAIAAKKRYVDTGISMSYEKYTTDIEKEYPKIITGISKNYGWTKNYEWNIQKL
jgi:hypothetical protein